MRRALRIITTLLPFLRVAALEIQEADQNDTGPDDRIGQGLDYFTKVFEDISSGKTTIPLPPLSLFTRSQIEELKGRIERAQEEGE